MQRYNTMQRYAILVAGGSGSRMKSEVPKQFLEIAQKPVLFYTLEKFSLLSPPPKIILVLPEKSIDFWKNLCLKHNFLIPHDLVLGGATRYQSVKNALSFIAQSKPEKALVAIHDGVRPFVDLAVLEESYRVASQEGSAVASVPLKESIRAVQSLSDSKSVARSNFRLIQTPQTFIFSEIWQAFGKVPDGENITDDASVLEFSGKKIHLIEGNYENIKITTPEDLIFAEAYIKNKYTI
ncbi:MAG: 2-C-methyl-D-erythritol 4-phosphate cytidylyltransferase [Raineya sp.]